MKRILGCLAACAVMTTVSAAPAAANHNTFDPQQKAAIEKIVHDYLVNKPEVLIEASDVLRQREKKSQEQKAEGSILQNQKDLFSQQSPYSGNPNGKVAVVEFFDYQCIHCQHMAPVLDKLVASNKSLRVIYKEFPIFGEGSVFASKAALAAKKQGKYQAFHDVLIKAPRGLDNDKILKIAKSVNLNIEQLQKDMNSQEVIAELEQTKKLADDLGIMGTPAFIVSATPPKSDSKHKPDFLPGAVPQATLQGAIDKAMQ